MKASELRIGNLAIDSRGVKTEITEVEFDNELHYAESFEKWNPIPLTEEWLIIGFSYDPLCSKTTYLKKFKSESINLRFELFIDVSGFYFHTKEFNLIVSTVHQLQNLYFALTGEELTIKK